MSTTNTIKLDTLLSNSARDDVSVADLRELYRIDGPTGLGEFIPIAEAAERVRVPLSEFYFSWAREHGVALLDDQRGGRKLVSERQLENVLEGRSASGDLRARLSHDDQKGGGEDAASLRRALYGEGE